MTQKTPPRISIISPIRNVEKYIARTLDSILDQSFQDWELIIIDGQSTDRTLEIVGSYVAKDPRMRLYSEPDEGVAHAADKGYQLAAGDFVTVVCGQDGFLDKDWLKKSVEVFDRDSSVSLVWSLSKMMADDGTLLEGYYDLGFAHLAHRETKVQTVFNLVKKGVAIVKDLLFASSERRVFLLQKLFSQNAPMRARLLLNRSFPAEKVPQKQEWFRYWLLTGIPFSDQSMVVDRKVFLACIPRYEMGSKAVGYMTDFYFNFNSRGYLSYFLPIYSVFARWHPNQSGEWGAKKMHVSFEKYLTKVREFKRMCLEGKNQVFIDRNGLPI